MNNPVSRRRRGFSLIELLVVVAIIGIIATIAIPLLLSTRQNALDEKARGCVRTVLSAQQTYYARYGVYGEFSELVLDAPPFLDQRFNGPTASVGQGIEISLELAGDAQTFVVTAVNPSGGHDYEGDQTMEIREL